MSARPRPVLRAEEKVSGTFFLAELDQFERMTEELGYRAGEEALQQVAEVLERQVRPGDVLGRWLEDQFILLLPAVNAESLSVVAERLRKAVEVIPYIVEGRRLPLTLSIGGASLIAKTGEAKELGGRKGVRNLFPCQEPFFHFAQGIAYVDFGFLEPSTLVQVARAARDGQGSAKGIEGKQVVRVALPLDALQRLEQQLQRVGQEIRGLRAPKS